MTDFTYEKDVLIWKVFQVIGVLVEIAVVVFWGIPFVLSIYTNLFVYIVSKICVRFRNNEPSDTGYWENICTFVENLL